LLFIYDFFSCYGPVRDLHSFPTRRSPDLTRRPADDRADPPTGAGGRLTKTHAPTGKVVRFPRARPRALARAEQEGAPVTATGQEDRKSTRLNSSHVKISYAGFCLKKKKTR